MASGKRPLDVELMKFILTLIVGIMVAISGYLITQKLEGIEASLKEINKKIHLQAIVNTENKNDVEYLQSEIEDHEKRITKLEKGNN